MKIIKIIYLNCYVARWYVQSEDIWHSNDRSSRKKVFCKNVFLEILQNSQENTCARVSF